MAELETHLFGQAVQLPAPLPFRNFVAQARLGVSREEHEAFFTGMLGDVDEPTAPFGLTDAQGDGSRDRRGIPKPGRSVEPAPARCRAGGGRECGEPVPPCLGDGAGAGIRTRRRGVRHAGVRPHARRRGGRPGHWACSSTLLPLRIQVGQEGVRASVRKTHGLLSQMLRHEHTPLLLAQHLKPGPGANAALYLDAELPP